MIIKIIAGALMLLAFQALAADRPAVHQDRVLDLHEHAELLEDPERSLSLDEILASDRQADFEPNNGRLPDIGGTNAGYWLRVWPELPATRNRWVVYVRQTELDRLCVYWPVSKQGKPAYVSECSGLDARRAGDNPGNRDYILEVPRALDGARPWYVYAHSDTWLALPLQLTTQATLMRLDHRYQFLWGLYYGAYFAVIAFALFTYLALRDRVWLYFAFHYLALGGAFLALQGRPMDFDFPGNIWWVTHGGPFFMSLFVSFGALFYQRYLGTGIYLVRSHKLLRIVGLGGLLTALLATVSPMWAYQLLGVVGLIFVGVVISGAIRLASRGYRFAYYALAALGLMLVIGGVKSVEVLGWELLPPEPSLNLFRFLALIGALVLVSGLADRILMLQRERDAAARENQRRRSELEHSNAELRRFSYIASHDLKQPLRGISGFAQLLRKRYAGQLDERAGEYLGYIEGGAKQANELIDGVLALSSTRDSVSRRALVDSRQLVEKARAVLNESLESSGTTLQVQDDLPEVVVDADQLVLVFRHLIENALRHAAVTTGTNIFVRGEPAAGGWLFSVSDDGPGVPENIRQTIFELFYRVERDDQQGTGLGLALCKRIVSQHGGKIWVDNRPGGGADFRFTIADSRQE